MPTRRDELNAERQRTSDELAKLEERWEAERAIVAEIDAVRGSIEAAASATYRRRRRRRRAVTTAQADRAKLAELSAQLRTLQGEQPLIFPVVDGQAIAEIVESWTGIPAGRMQSDEIRTVLNLREAMERRVVGQSHAMEAVAQADPHQPRRADRSTPADRRLPVRRHVGRRQDGNRPQPRRSCSMAASRTSRPSTWRSSRKSIKSAC